MKNGAKVSIIMGKHKGDGVVQPKKGSGASPTELVIKLDDGRKVIVPTAMARPRK